jgi:inositol phosphorylceramide mannosyltransferase catalytic subunit
VIRRTLHRLWLGQRPRPAQYDAFWADWQALHPTWTLVTWTDHNLPPLINDSIVEDLVLTARSAGIPMSHDRAVAVARADVIAYELVWRFGGVYVNCDMQPLKSFEPLLKHSMFVGKEDDHYLCNAVIGAERHHPLLADIIDKLPNNYSRHRTAGMELATGPQFLTRVAEEYDGDDVTVLPREAFYFAHHGSIQPGEDASAFVIRAREAGAYALHHWGHRTQEGDLQPS